MMKNKTKNTAKKKKNDKNKRLIKPLLIGAIALLAIWTILVVIYAALKGGEYLADWDAMREYDAAEGDYSMTSIDNGDTICFVPDEIKAGLIFYQDELVENSAYIPLMRKLASSGVLCVVPTMPFNLANLDKDAAQELKNEYPDVKFWYIGGHGLGGEAAASYLSKNSEGFVGLILLGSYSSRDLREPGLPVLSVYGTKDGVLNMKKYERFKKNLPETNFEELVIEGANHSGFAVYGLHDGDNEAEIAGQEQIDITAEKIIDFMF